MPNAKIQETTVSPDASGATVQLQISDVPLPAEDAAIRITLAVRVPAYRCPLLAHYQREAIQIALDQLRDLALKLGIEIQNQTHNQVHPDAAR